MTAHFVLLLSSSIPFLKWYWNLPHLVDHRKVAPLSQPWPPGVLYCWYDDPLLAAIDLSSRSHRFIPGGKKSKKAQALQNYVYSVYTADLALHSSVIKSVPNLTQALTFAWGCAEKFVDYKTCSDHNWNTIKKAGKLLCVSRKSWAPKPQRLTLKICVWHY